MEMAYDDAQCKAEYILETFRAKLCRKSSPKIGLDGLKADSLTKTPRKVALTFCLGYCDTFNLVTCRKRISACRLVFIWHSARSSKPRFVAYRKLCLMSFSGVKIVHPVTKLLKPNNHFQIWIVGVSVPPRCSNHGTTEPHKISAFLYRKHNPPRQHFKFNPCHQFLETLTSQNRPLLPSINSLCNGPAGMVCRSL